MKPESSLPRKSICFLTEYFDVGGRENVIIDAIKCLSKDYDITIASMYGISDDVRSKLDSHVIIHSNLMGNYYKPLDFVMLSLPFIGPHLYRRYVPGKYDYLIVLHPSLLLTAYTKIGKKTICWTHTDKDVRFASNHKLSIAEKI